MIYKLNAVSGIRDVTNMLLGCRPY